MPDQPAGSKPEHKHSAPPTDAKVEKTPAGVVISRRWSFKPDDVFIGGIGFFLLVFEVGNLLYASGGGLGILEYFFIIFGPIMLYFSLAHRFNSTRFTVSTGKVTVRRGPLPWPGAKVFSSAEIEKLSVREDKRQTRRSGWRTYRVAASLRDGREVVLDTCENEEQARFVSQELERSLSIPS